MKKGIVFTIDALIGLVSVMIISAIIVVSLQDYSIETQDVVDLHQRANMVLHAGEQTLVSVNETQYSSYLNLTMNNRWCAKLSLFNQTHEALVASSTCTDTNETRVSAIRTILINDTLFYGKLEVWWP